MALAQIDRPVSHTKLTLKSGHLTTPLNGPKVSPKEGIYTHIPAKNGWTLIFAHAEFNGKIRQCKTGIFIVLGIQDDIHVLGTGWQKPTEKIYVDRGIINSRQSPTAGYCWITEQIWVPAAMMCQSRCNSPMMRTQPNCIGVIS